MHQFRAVKTARGVTGDPALRRAYDSCQRLARRHYENFPVASRLLPAAIRPHIAAVYAFARCADDFADEGTRPPAERLALLDSWQARLLACRSEGAGDEHAPPDHPMASDVFLALGHTMRRYDLPPGLFTDLLSAFRQDVTQHRYESWVELLDYCGRSANPVGRIVLRLSGYRDDRLDRASDSVCSALQITNFLQDFRRDWRQGRLYVPAQVYEACGALVADLDEARLTPAWRAALAACTDRTRALFSDGRHVCNGVSGRLRLELRVTWLGGMRILDRLERTRYDPQTGRPTLGLADAVPLFWNALVWT